MGDKSSMRIEIIVNASRKSLILMIKKDSTTYEQLLKMACNKMKKASTKHCSLYYKGELIKSISDFVSVSIEDGDQIWLLANEKEKYQGPSTDHYVEKATVDAKISIVADEDVFIEQEAVDQIHTLVHSSDGNIIQAVGMPDLHHGPTGVAILAKEPIPKIPGYDIGCGMSLFETNIPANISQEKIIRCMAKINIDSSEDPTDAYLGTLGGGNHFAELLRIDETVALHPAVVNVVHPEKVYLLVHSGSRGHGERVFQEYVHDHQDTARYMEEHTALINWAKYNRQTIATRFLQQFHHQHSYHYHTGENEHENETETGMSMSEDVLLSPLIDIAHNYIERIAMDRCTVIAPSSSSASSSSSSASDTYYLHRKGAAPAYTNTFSLLPGSRGTASYILLGHGQAEQLFSLAHGAGRKLSRADARKKRAGNSASASDLTNGGSIICKNQDLLYEEAPFAYKDVEAVVACMQSYDMCSIGARLLPLATYKTATIG